MSFDYRAYGLTLTSDFELAGVAAAGGAAPVEVELRLVGGAELDAAWSGPASLGSWRGKLRDGADFEIRWGRGGDLLFAYGEGRARFMLDPAASRLDCDPADAAALDWRRVLLTRVLPLVAVARGSEALHAGAVDTEAGAVAVLAPSGGGKSTLTAELVRRGAELIADDVVVLSREEDGVRVHPASFHLSLVDDADAPGEVVGTLGGKSWVAVAGTDPAPRRLSALALLDRTAGSSPRARELPSSPLALAPFMLGLPDEEATREAERFELYSDLVGEARLIELTASPSDPPAAIAVELERAVRSLPAATVGAGR